MLTRTFATLTTTLWLAAMPALAAPPAVAPVDVLYRDALNKETAVRAALTPTAAPTVLKAVRTVIEQYEGVVYHYPVSSYSDDSLWRAGQLAIDAFKLFGDPKEKATAMKDLRQLASQYPASKWAKQVNGELARVGGLPERAPVVFPESPASGAATNPAIAAAKPDAIKAKPNSTGTSIITAGTTITPVRPPAESANTPVAPKPDAATAATTPALPASAGVKRPVAIKDIRRILLPDVVRVVIDMDGETPFHDERIADPLRIFVDLAPSVLAPTLVDRTIRFDGDTDVVRQIRTGRHPDSTTRIVLEAAGISSYSVYPLYSPYRLVIDCIREKPLAPLPAPSVSPATDSAPRTTAITPAPSTPLRAGASSPLNTGASPSLSAGATSAVQPPSGPNAADAYGTVLQPPASVPMPPPIVPAFAGPTKPASPPPTTVATIASAALGPATPPPPVPPSRNIAGGFSIARQLGLGISKIVIDPGHGGHDPGAKSNGTTEAELVLDVALRLEKLLQKQPGVEVVLTRRTDEYIPLQERTAIANREGADLFLSIHANASTNGQARGIETYYLNFASNLSAAAVAARENAASGQSMGALPDFVKAIALNNKLDESRDLATMVQRGMLDKAKESNKGVKDLGVKQAPFVVLIGAAMPSVLAELAFVTNSQEAKLLKNGAYRQRLAEGLLNAIKKYQTSLKSESKVAVEKRQ